MELTLKILLVEDNPGDVELMKEMLYESKARSSTIIEAGSLEQVIIELQENDFDIILLDLGLPDSAGLMTLTDVLKYARKIPIVVLTGLDDEGLAVEAIRKGAEDYLTKNNMDVDVLLRVLRYAIERKRVREALRASEKKYRNLVDEIHDGIYNSDTDGNLTFANNALCSLLGYEENELIGMPISMLIMPDARDKFIALYKETIRTGKSHGVLEVPVQDKNGNVLLIEIKPVVIRRGGKPVGSRGVVRDITERKQWEKQLQASENRYRSFVENFHGIAFRSRLDWIPLYFHGAVKEITGYTDAEFINGKPRWDEIIHNDDLQRLMSSGNQVGIERVGYNADREYRIITKGGEVKWLHDYIQTVYDDALGENILQGALYDITARKNVEEALRESEGILNQFMMASPELVYIKDEKHRFYKLSKSFEKLFGKPLSELIGKDLYELLPPELAQIVYEDDLKVLQENIKVSAEERLNDKVFSSIKFPIHRESGKPDFLGGYSIDITKRTRAEEELKINRERLKTATSILRHDIINDLSVIKSAVDIYRDEQDETMIDEIEKRVKKTIETINNQREQVKFLDSHADLDEYDVKDVILEVIKNFPELEYTLTGSGTGYADNAIYSVVENIINNAIKHGKTAKLDVDIIPNKEHCEIRFKDHGTGIPDGIKDKIFDEGFHYGESGHTGIGLYIVKKTIEEYGGEVSVEDNKPSGAVFVICLRKTINSS